MAKRTRVFLFAAAGVLTAVLATGLAARAGVAAPGSNSPDELAYVPATVQMVSYVDVRQVMNSPLHDRVRQFQGTSPVTADSLETRTGVNFDRDVDRVVVASIGGTPGVGDRSLVIARGRFDTVRVEALMRQQGAQVVDYRGHRLIAIKDASHDAALVFAEPALLLFGAQDGVRGALDARAGAAAGIKTNGEFMALVDSVDEGTAWSVAKFDSVSGLSALPSAVTNQLPPIDWLAASGRVDSGVHGLLRAEARDEPSAQSLRDVVQGFLALARLQGSRDPAYKGMLDSVTLNSEGKSVSLSFDLSPAVLDALSSQGGAIRRR